jgi:hypothetical protein
MEEIGIFLAIGNILRPFVTFYGYFGNLVENLVYPPHFWYIV